MAGHHDSHGSEGGMEWFSQNLGGIVMPFGKKFETLLERMMFLVVNGFFRRAATFYLAVFTPLIVLEFLMKFVRL